MVRKQKFAWTRYTGEDFSREWTYVDPSDLANKPINITGFSFEIRFPDSANIDTIVATIADASAGNLSFNIPKEAATGEIGRVYPAQAWRISPSGDEEVLITGTLKILEGYLA